METREKQAYLIEAHKCDEMLLTLLRMLDVPWNDIFIHMDSKNTDYQPETVECRMKYAKVFHAKRHSVVWGGVSQVKVELVLLKTAVAHGPYQHYHLISGVDLPIQTQEDIRAFFEANPDVEFVHFDPHPFSPFNDERVYYRHFFQNIDLRRHPVLGVINGILLSGQKLLKIKRNQDVHFTKGSQLVQLHGRLCTVSADKRRVDPAGAGQDLLLGRVLCADTDRAVAVSG
ncbi:MAG: beta-1,6-N-acetylglucosaminyltransferase [Faecalibacterium sp.]